MPYGEPAAFEALAGAVLAADATVDRSSLYLRAEASDFLRFNRAALRQATSVRQAHATLAVERGRRRAESLLALAGDPALDAPLLRAEREQLKQSLDWVPDDPWLSFPTAPAHSHRDERGVLPEPAALIALVHEVAGARLAQDLVGFHAAGPVLHAFADSLGTRHWHRVDSFHFEWCLAQRTDKAVKSSYAGTHWSDAALIARLEEGARRVPLLARGSHLLAPGAYRAALAPAAVVELMGLLGWGGVSLRARRTGVSSLMRLAEGSAAFAPGFELDEATADGGAPAFTAEGTLRPPRVALVERGALPPEGGTLNSPRSAAEFGVPANGAGPDEMPEALRLRPGALAHDELLAALDTGLYISNLWYLNYSDRRACRATGMTRYACFWVEHGQLQAPLDPMRFDDDVLRLFGAGLLGLGDRAELFPNSDTWRMRELGAFSAPAALVEGLRLTL